MATGIHDVVRALQSIFTSRADLAARETGFVRRSSKFTGSRCLQTLTFGWLQNPKATLNELAQTATSLGTPMSPQGVDQRFGPRAAAFLERMLHEAVLRVISTDPVAIPLLQRFSGVCLLDSTILTLPAVFASAWPGYCREGAEAGIKAQVRLNLLDGNLTGPFLSPANCNDQKGAIHKVALPPGTLRLADLGFFSLESLKQMSQQGVYWLTRVQVETRLIDAANRVWSLAEFLKAQSGDRIDVPMFLGRTHRLPCRVLAMRVPASVAAKRRRRLLRRDRDRGSSHRHRPHGRKVHPDRWALAEWNFYVTNIPNEMLRVEEAWVLARCRWQIELLFKLWKSEGHIDESRSKAPWRILCEIYAKLLGMVVQHWVLLIGCWSHADRSLVKASRTMRMHALSLAAVLSFGPLVYRILLNVRRCLASGCRVSRRRRGPPTHQLLLDLPKAG